MKDIKDYLHLYLGSYVLDPLNKSTYLVTYEFLNSRWDEDENQFHNGLKLILRPLESMSPQEKSDYKRLSKHSFKGKNLLPGISCGRMLNLFLNSNTPFEVAFLLKHGFDIFDLHAAGLAVYETDLEDPCDYKELDEPEPLNP